MVKQVDGNDCSIYDYMQQHSNCETFIIILKSISKFILLFMHLFIWVLRDWEAYVFCPVQSLKYQTWRSHQRWKVSCHGIPIENHFKGRLIFRGCDVSWCTEDRCCNWKRRENYLNKCWIIKYELQLYKQIHAL